MKNSTILKVLVLWTMSVTFYGCSDFLEIGNPSTQVSSNSIFEDDATATSAIIGIYSEMASSSGFASGGLSSVTLLAGRSADDLINYSQSASAEFTANELTENNSYVNSYLWQEAYRYIYDANAILEGLDKSTTLSPNVKDQLQGEARFIRAFCYFYLINLFKEVPLLTGTDYRINSVASRLSAEKVYAQIIADLLQAKTLLKDDYSASQGQKTRPNRLAATAMLARVYLFTNDWAKAEAEASQVINSSIVLEPDLDKVFLKNSSETIWQLIPTPGNNTKEGAALILTTTPTEVSLSSELMNSFEAGDARKSKWTQSITAAGNVFHYPFKYKIKSATAVTEYSMILRLAEQYFIRAEARAHEKKLSESVSDVDILRARAGLPLYQDTNPSLTENELLLVIEQERRAELFSEWGHRWLDLKRTKRAGVFLTGKNTASWQDTDEFYPIPFQEIQNNINLLPQNPGY